MRKMLWCSCLTGTVVAASLFWSAWYVYKNPTSLLSRCATAGFNFSVRCNPLLTGVSTAALDVSKLLGCGDGAADKGLAHFERPDEPCEVAEPGETEPAPLIELPGVVEMPPPVPAIVIDEENTDFWSGAIMINSKEPPLADQAPSDKQPATIYDPALRRAAGTEADDNAPEARRDLPTGHYLEHTPGRFMPYCTDDEAPANGDCPHHPVEGAVLGGAAGAAVGGIVGSAEPCPTEDCGDGWFSWCWKMVANCWSAAPAVSGSSWFSACEWYGFFASPSVLGEPGDVELSEPMDTNGDPSNCMEDPNRSYHSSGCPYSGVCPYTGRMPSCEPPVAEPPQKNSEEQSEPKKESKKKIKLPTWWGGEIEISEDAPVPAPASGIDTMEFRPSDRTWDDYGPPSDL